MKLLELKCTIIGIIIALVLTGLFNASYWFTMLVINNQPYALNLAGASIIVTLIGVIIDLVRNINFNKPKEVFESDLTPKGYTTIFPDKEPVLKNEQEVQDLEQEKNQDEKILNNSYQKEYAEHILD
jgi:hypothetical protein